MDDFTLPLPGLSPVSGDPVTACFDGGRRLKGTEMRSHLRRLVRAMRSHWARVEFPVRADGHDGVPESYAAFQVTAA